VVHGFNWIRCFIAVSSHAGLYPAAHSWLMNHYGRGMRFVWEIQVTAQCSLKIAMAALPCVALRPCRDPLRASF